MSTMLSLSSSKPSTGCDDMDLFAPVLAAMKLDRLPHLASVLRYHKEHPSSSAETGYGEPSKLVDCTVLSARCGAFNIAFPIRFTDEVHWILKVPYCGYTARFDDGSARALLSEAHTLQYLKRETSIPVPEVYSFDNTLNNELNCPFIMMEYMQGASVSELWFQYPSSEPKQKLFRERVLKGLAAAMVQLNKFTFSQGGSPVFSKENEIVGFGPTRFPDFPKALEFMHDDKAEEAMFFCEHESYSDLRSELHAMAIRHDVSICKLGRGIRGLLHLFIDWIPCQPGSGKKEFVLAHPDLDQQNVLVSEEGDICGIIDWDGVSSVPHFLGCEQYPLWLMNEWIPQTYKSEEDQSNKSDNSDEEDNGDDKDQGDKSDNANEGDEGDGNDRGDEGGDDENFDTHSEISYYRSIYADFMDSYLSTNEDTKRAREIGESPSLFPGQTVTKGITRSSVLFQSLEMAAMDPTRTFNIVECIFDDIKSITAPDLRDDSSIATTNTDNNQTESDREATYTTTSFDASIDNLTSNETNTSMMAMLASKDVMHANETDKVRAAQFENESLCMTKEMDEVTRDDSQKTVCSLIYSDDATDAPFSDLMNTSMATTLVDDDDETRAWLSFNTEGLPIASDVHSSPKMKTQVVVVEQVFESYYKPGSIRKKAKKQKFMRVFRELKAFFIGLVPSRNAQQIKITKEKLISKRRGFLYRRQKHARPKWTPASGKFRLTWKIKISILVPRQLYQSLQDPINMLQSQLLTKGLNVPTSDTFKKVEQFSVTQPLDNGYNIRSDPLTLQNTDITIILNDVQRGGKSQLLSCNVIELASKRLRIEEGTDETQYKAEHDEEYDAFEKDGDDIQSEDNHCLDHKAIKENTETTQSKDTQDMDHDNIEEDIDDARPEDEHDFTKDTEDTKSKDRSYFERDYGNFDVWDVAYGFVDGSLDEARKLRLRTGFLALIRNLQLGKAEESCRLNGS